MSEGVHDDDEGAAEAGPPSEAARLACDIRAATRAMAGLEADRLRLIHRLDTAVAERVRVELAGGPRVSSQPDDLSVIESAVAAETAAVLRVSEFQARALLSDARAMVTGPLGDTLAALAAGRLDLARARALVEATADLRPGDARRVQAQMLDPLDRPGAGPDALPSPRAWRDRLARVVTRVDPGAARRRAQRAVEQVAVRVWAEPDGLGVLQIRDLLDEVTLADQVLTDLAHAEAAHDQHGQPLSLDQRRIHALRRIWHHINDGSPLPHTSTRHDRELGLVMHTDTLFTPDDDHGDMGDPGDRGNRGDGGAEVTVVPVPVRAAGRAPGQLRGLGDCQPVDPQSAREAAARMLGGGAATRVLLTDRHGVLQRLIRLPAPPGGGWTPAALAAAVRHALDPADAAALAAGQPLPPLHTERYTPTMGIGELVRAGYPRCTAYDCPRASRACDLDHDTPWPRGPTDTTNLCPRCRRHHQLKTRRLHHTTRQPDGSLHTRMLTGLRITTTPGPLPGHAPGEGYTTTA